MPARRATAGPGAGGDAEPAVVEPTIKQSLLNACRYSWLNVLLVAVPISWALHFAIGDGIPVFIVSGLAIIPCAGLLSFATEELAARLGDTLGALVNASFGNAVELIIAILALVKGEITVVQSAMVGSILSNCLLVLGCCFIAGGLRFHSQAYTVRHSQLHITILGLSVLAIIMPAALHYSLDSRSRINGTQTVAQAAGLSEDDETSDVEKVSRGTAILLLFVYFIFLVYQLWTHAYLYKRTPADELQSRTMRSGADSPAPPSEHVFRLPDAISRRMSHSSGTSSDSSTLKTADDEDDDEHHKPKLSLVASIVVLTVATALAGVTAEWLTDSISSLTEGGKVSPEFVGLILLPVIGNAAEHSTAVLVAIKNKVDLAMGVAVGSSIQIALLVLPFLVLLGWWIGQPLALDIDILEAITLFISVVMVAWAISDGTTNYMEGVVLVMTYVIIALTFWFYPGSSGLTG